MAGFDPYDPLVQQALQAQGSQYVVPPAQSWGVTPPELPQPDMALTSVGGQQMFEAPRMLDAQGIVQPLQAPPARLAPLNERMNPDAIAEEPAVAPPAPPVQRAPARRQSQSKQRMEQGLEGILGSFDDRREAAQKRAEIQEQTGRATADLMDRSSVDDLMAQQELADAHDTHMRATAKVEQEKREIANFVENYVPTDRRTNQQRVMGAIAVALAGYGDALSAEGGGSGGHADRVLGIINTSIDRDIDLQRQMLDNKRTALAAKNSELGSMRQRYGDTVEATKLARAMKLDQSKRELEGIVARGSSQEAAALVQDTVAQLDEQQGKILYEVFGQRYQQEMAAGRGMSAEKKLSLEGKALDNEGKLLANEERRQALLALPGGDKKIRAQIQAKEAVLATVDKIKKLRAANPIERGMPGWLPGVSAPAQLEALNAELTIKLNKDLGGALDEGNREVIGMMTGDPATWGSDAVAKLDEIRRSLEREKAVLGGPEAMRAYKARMRGQAGAAR